MSSTHFTRENGRACTLTLLFRPATDEWWSSNAHVGLATSTCSGEQTCQKWTQNRGKLKGVECRYVPRRRHGNVRKIRQVLLFDDWRHHGAAAAAAAAGVVELSSFRTSALIGGGGFADIQAVYAFTQVDPLGCVVLTAVGAPPQSGVVGVGGKDGALAAAL